MKRQWSKPTRAACVETCPRCQHVVIASTTTAAALALADHVRWCLAEVLPAI